MGMNLGGVGGLVLRGEKAEAARGPGRGPGAGAGSDDSRSTRSARKACRATPRRQPRTATPHHAHGNFLLAMRRDARCGVVAARWLRGGWPKQYTGEGWRRGRGGHGGQKGTSAPRRATPRAPRNWTPDTAPSYTARRGPSGKDCSLESTKSSKCQTMEPGQLAEGRRADTRKGRGPRSGDVVVNTARIEKTR